MAAAAGAADGELMIETDGDNLGASHIVTGEVSSKAIKVPSLRLQRILEDAGVRMSMRSRSMSRVSRTAC